MVGGERLDLARMQYAQRENTFDLKEKLNNGTSNRD
jgi:hypothetical protein